MTPRADIFRKAVFFFFNAVFAFCAALFVHECGHALFIKWIHGYYPRMTMNPLAGGYVSYYAAPATAAERLWISAGGILVGITAGVACAAAGLAVRKTVWAAPLILWGIVSLSVNSLMLAAGYFLFATGDLHRMAASGFSVPLATGLGLAGLLLSGYLLVRALPYFGLDHTSALAEKYWVLGSGVAVYGTFVLTATALAGDAPGLAKKSVYVGATVSVLAVGVWLVDRTAGRLPGTAAVPCTVRNRHLVFSAALAAAAFILTGT